MRIPTKILFVRTGSHSKAAQSPSINNSKNMNHTFPDRFISFIHSFFFLERHDDSGRFFVFLSSYHSYRFLSVSNQQITCCCRRYCFFLNCPKVKQISEHCQCRSVVVYFCVCNIPISKCPQMVQLYRIYIQFPRNHLQFVF